MEIRNETGLEVMMKAAHIYVMISPLVLRPEDERKYLCSKPCPKGLKVKHTRMGLATQSSETDKVGAKSRLDIIPETLCSQRG